MLPTFIVNLLSFLSTSTACLDKSAKLCESHLDTSIEISMSKLKARKALITDTPTQD